MGQETEVETLRRELAEAKQLHQEQEQRLKELQEILGRPEVKNLLRKTGDGKNTFYGAAKKKQPAAPASNNASTKQEEARRQAEAAQDKEAKAAKASEKSQATKEEEKVTVEVRSRSKVN